MMFSSKIHQAIANTNDVQGGVENERLVSFMSNSFLFQLEFFLIFMSSITVISAKSSLCSMIKLIKKSGINLYVYVL